MKWKKLLKMKRKNEKKTFSKSKIYLKIKKEIEEVISFLFAFR